MKTRIVSIGNSQGVRIPKPLLEQAGLKGEVEITAKHDALIIRSLRKSRDGWAAAFQEMSQNGDDVLLDSGTLALSRWDADEWEW